MSYKHCLEKTKKRKDLSLCPRGYCTAKHKFDVYPSAYANGYASQVCNGSKPDIEGNKKNDYSETKSTESNLSRWFKEDWVNVCERTPDGKFKPCGRANADLDPSDYPYCRPMNKLSGTTVKTVGELSSDQLKKMCRKKRSVKPGINGKPSRVFVADLLIQNPDTGRLVKVNGRVGKQQTGAGSDEFLPNMALVEKYNIHKNKQGSATYKGKDVVLYAPELSDKGKKKLIVYVKDPETDSIEVVHFGHRDYEDYTIHRNSDRKNNYCARSAGITCKGNECDITSPNYWSRMALWNCSGGN